MKFELPLLRHRPREAKHKLKSTRYLTKNCRRYFFSETSELHPARHIAIGVGLATEPPTTMRPREQVHARTGNCNENGLKVKVNPPVSF